MDEWSARGDSNPDLHGLNVPRLPVAPRAHDGGDHGQIRTATGQALDLLPLPDWATWPLVPPGGLEPPLHGLRARRVASHYEGGVELIPGIVRPARSEFGHASSTAIALRSRGPDVGHTRAAGCRYIRSAWSEWRDSNPHLKAWKARRQPLPHIRIWFGLRVSNPSLRAGNAGCIPPHPSRTWTGVVHRPIAIRQFSKTPLLRAWWAARDSNPIAPEGERGYGSSADHPLVPPVWRQRQDSNPDPRALEARMLPLHHAAVAASRFDRLQRQNLPVTWRGLSSAR